MDNQEYRDGEFDADRTAVLRLVCASVSHGFLICTTEGIRLGGHERSAAGRFTIMAGIGACALSSSRIISSSLHRPNSMQPRADPIKQPNGSSCHRASSVCAAFTPLGLLTWNMRVKPPQGNGSPCVRDFCAEAFLDEQAVQYWCLR